MLSNVERHRRIGIIRRFPARLEALIETLSDDQLNTAYIPGEWSVRQIVHHLPDSHMNSVIRLKFILTQENPTLQPYDQAVWAELPDVAGTPVNASLLLLKGLHERWCVLWESLTDEQRQRTGFHPEIGKVTPDDLLVTYSDHCDIHWEQISRTLEAAPKA